MKNLIIKWKQFKYDFMRKLIRKYGRTIGKIEKTLTDDIKIKFEKDVLKLLRKYDVIDNKQHLQKVEIIADVEKYPKIKLETLVI